eukprot:g1971.t1
MYANALRRYGRHVVMRSSSCVSRRCLSAAAVTGGGGDGTAREAKVQAVLDRLPARMREEPIRYKEAGEEFVEVHDADPNFEESSVKVRYRDAQGRMYSTGWRKSAIARVWIKEVENGEEPIFTVNKKPIHEYFQQETSRLQALSPLALTNTCSKYHVTTTAKGGGYSGQAQAVRHGLATALRYADPSLRLALKREGWLTRDSRIVERKKPGRKKARKSKQWVKR